VTVEVREGHGLPADSALDGSLPVDPLEQDWDAIVAAILRDGPSYPEDLLDEVSPGDRIDHLRVAGAPVQDGPVDGPAVAALLAGLDLGSGSR
jgi:hypothetical protein